MFQRLSTSREALLCHSSVRSILTRLCHACMKIFEGENDTNYEGFIHHPTPFSFHAARSIGCRLCCYLWGFVYFYHENWLLSSAAGFQTRLIRSLIGQVVFNFSDPRSNELLAQVILGTALPAKLEQFSHLYLAFTPLRTIQARATLNTTKIPINLGHSLQFLQDQLPRRIFNDAVIVARSCHVRYLWIDSSCIMQDDI